MKKGFRIYMLLLILCLGSLFYGKDAYAVSSGTNRTEVAVADTHSKKVSEGQKNVLLRARQMLDLTWVSLKDMKGYISTNGTLNNYYYQNETYRGIPYSQPVDSGKYVPFNASFNTMIKATKDIDSLYYTSRSSYGSKNGVYYANDCSAFVSYCYDISRLTTASIARSSIFTKVGTDVRDAKVCDCINRASDHVVLITDMLYDKDEKLVYVEISEQTAKYGCCVTYLYTVAEVNDWIDNNGYTILRYDGIDDVEAPEAYTGQNSSKIDTEHAYDNGVSFRAYLKSKLTDSFLTNNESGLSMASQTNGADQIWHFLKKGDGSYMIRSAYDDRFLYPDGEGGITLSDDQAGWMVYTNNGIFVFKNGDSYISVNELETILPVEEDDGDSKEASDEAKEGSMEGEDEEGEDSEPEVIIAKTYEPGLTSDLSSAACRFGITKISTYNPGSFSTYSASQTDLHTVKISFSKLSGYSQVGLRVYDSEGKLFAGFNHYSDTSVTLEDVPFGTYTAELGVYSARFGLFNIHRKTIEVEPITYDIVYDAGGGSGSMSKQTITYGVSKKIRENTFTREGFDFECFHAHRASDDKWYTTDGWKSMSQIEENGFTLKAYVGGEKVSKQSKKKNDTIYMVASWIPHTYTIIYDGNGGSGSMKDQPMTYGSDKKLRTNTFTMDTYYFAGWMAYRLSDMTYKTKSGWKSASEIEDSGLSYYIYKDKAAASRITSVDQDTVIMYAVWEPLYYQLCFDGDGGEGYMAPERVRFGDSYVLPLNSFHKKGYFFKGWKAVKNNDGSVLTQDGWKSEGEVYLLLDGSADSRLSDQPDDLITLHAVWEKITAEVNFDAAGGNSEFSPSTFSYGDSFKVDDRAFVKDGYHFLGLYALRDDGAVFAAEGWAWEATPVLFTDRITFDDAFLSENTKLTLVAVWNPAVVNIHYAANGGSGSMKDVKVSYQDGKKVKSCSFEKEGFDAAGFAAYREDTDSWYTDEGWKSTDDLYDSDELPHLFAKGDLYDPLLKGNVTAITLYVYWQKKTPVILYEGMLTEEIAYEISDQGILYLNGKGEIPSVEEADQSILASYRDLITSAVLSKGITAIGDHAFSAQKKLTRIEIPASVKNISETAFLGLTDLTIVAEKTSYAKEYADTCGFKFSKVQKEPSFYDAVYYENYYVIEEGGIAREEAGYTITSSRLTISSDAAMFNKVTVDGREYLLTSIPWENKKSKINDVEILDGVTTIAAGAFSDMKFVERVQIGKDVKVIGECAFAGMDKLSRVIFMGNAPVMNGKLIFEADETSVFYPEKDSSYQVIRDEDFGGSLSFEAYGDTLYLCNTPLMKEVKNSAAGVKISYGSVVGAELYRIYRKESGGSYKKLADNEGLSFTDKTAESGKTYTYAVRVISKDKKSLSARSKGLSLMCLAAVKKGMITLSNITKGIRIKWEKIDEATSYDILRKKEGGSYSVIANISADKTLSYTDTSAVNGEHYYYAVRALAGSVKAGYEGLDKYRISTPDMSLTSSEEKIMVVNWTPNSFAAGYQIRYSLQSDLSDTKTIDVTNPSNKKRTIKKLKSGRTYYVKMRSYTVIGGKTIYSAFTSVKSIKVK